MRLQIYSKVIIRVGLLFKRVRKKGEKETETIEVRRYAAQFYVFPFVNWKSQRAVVKWDCTNETAKRNERNRYRNGEVEDEMVSSASN